MEHLVRVSGVDAEEVLVVDLGGPHIAIIGPPDGDDHVLADGHGQHRVALIVDVLLDQIHPPYSNNQPAHHCDQPQSQLKHTRVDV